MERRDNRRFNRRIEVRFWRRGDSLPHSAFTTNISRTGLFLGTSMSLVPGERLRLEIVDAEEGFIVEGHVARAHRVSVALRQVAQPGAGVQFLTPDMLIDRFLPVHARQEQPAEEAPQEYGGADGQGPPMTSAPPPPTTAPGAGSADPAARSDSGARLVTVTFNEPSAFLSVFHRDIQFGGLFVSSDTPAEINEIVRIDFALPLTGVSMRPFMARVVQRFEPEAAVGGGRNVLSGMAVQFLEPERVVAELKPMVVRLRS